MTIRGAKEELAATRRDVPRDRYSRTKGRNGWFSPRAIEAVIHRHRDGTPLVTIRQYSRRSPASAGAPCEFTMPLVAYRQFARQIETTLDDALTNGALDRS